MKNIFQSTISYLLLVAVAITLMPVELIGNDLMVGIELIEHEGGEKDAENGQEEGEDNLNENGESSDAILSLNLLCQGHHLDVKMSPWLRHLWDNALSEVISPPPERLA